MLPDEITTYIQEKWSGRSMKPLAGGDINQVYRLDTSKGTFCLKFNSAERFPGMFEQEAFGLTLLGDAKILRVPSVVEVASLNSYSLLLMEYIQSSAPVRDFMFRFGHSLAILHDQSAPAYGLDRDNYMGSLPQSNRKHADWIDFFRTERLEQQLRLARDSGNLTGALSHQFAGLLTRLDRLLTVDKPALLHGDLWNGNFMVSENGEACLIDPAVYYGHREVDLAMTALFGGFSPDFYAGYEAHHKLVPGWRERLEIYQLYPLLVHVNLFGIGYLGFVKRILTRFG